MIIEIPQSENGLVRVFAVNADVDAIRNAVSAKGKAQVASALLGHPLSEGGFDLVALSDLEGVGLANYLIQGWDVPAEDLKDSRTKLDRLEGYVLLVFTSAFDFRNVTLTIGPDLTLIGTYAEERSDSSTIALESDAAAPYTGVPSTTPPTPPHGRAGGSLIVVGLAVMAALILWWAFS